MQYFSIKDDLLILLFAVLGLTSCKQVKAASDTANLPPPVFISGQNHRLF
jgi:hypothetical protein